MRTTSQRLGKTLCVRLSEADDQALAQWAARLGEPNRTIIVRQLICELAGSGPYLLGNDLNALREAVRELRSVGVNLNQLMRAINSGQVTLPTAENIELVSMVLAATEALRQELNAIILHSRNKGMRYGLGT